MLNISLNPASLPGLTEVESAAMQRLLDIYLGHAPANWTKNRYYEGNIPVSTVNLGIALPLNFSGLEIGCAWGAKCVDVLAARSMFDGFVGVSGGAVEELDRLVINNRLVAEYMKACRDELKYGCTFATLSADKALGCKIRFHSPMTAAAVWDGDKGRIAYGMAIMDTAPENNTVDWTPSVIRLDLEDEIVVFRRFGSDWGYERFYHKMGRPLMEPLVWNATSAKPFGRSRIKFPIRQLINSYVRTVANATLGLEFSTAPQKYLLGVTDQQFDALINKKFQQYVGNIIAATTNPETGEKPSFGQLPQGSITPHVEMLKLLACQFGAATGLTVTDTGVISDANPTSSDAILAQSQTLVAMAEQLNVENGDALRSIALMALAITHNTTMENLSDEEKDVVAHFKNPAMPSVAVTADAAIKIASVRPAFAQTDTFLEMIGFDKADIRRIKSQETMVRGQAVLDDLGIGLA